LQSEVRGRSEDMLTPLAGGIPERMTLTERSNRHNPVREDGSVSSAVLLPSAASRNPGAGTVFLLGWGCVRGRAKPTPCRSSAKKIFEKNRQITTCKIVP